ncbi:MAG: MBL fold metallo-hydrolase [Lachnospiraceae bacterium]|nr:MBL fold metallo-hydrolase [Lachnospiraceae bacterium]
MEITKDIRHIGVNDHDIDLFESQYHVPDGMAYNSYIIIDDKITVVDTVEIRFKEEWLRRIEEETSGKAPDYLIIQHMEPDHSSNILSFMEKYPEARIVASAKTFTMMVQFYGTDFPERKIVIKEGDTLETGHHSLTFVAAPMVHWPEVMFTYDSVDKVLFSIDAFGKFGANDVPSEGWADEARRYYIGIVGKYGTQVQSVLKKAAAIDIQTICPSHGPVLTENLCYYIGLYDTWSSYRPETEGIVINYTSVYGHTREAVMKLEAMLKEKGAETVVVNDLARCDMSKAIADAFRYSKVVLATTTYNMGIFPFMETFLNGLVERNFQNRIVGVIENGTWAPKAAGIIKGMLANSKDITFTETTVSIKSALNEASEAQLRVLAEELAG